MPKAVEKERKSSKREIKEQHLETAPLVKEIRKSNKETEEAVIDGLVDTGSSQMKVRVQPSRDNVLAEFDNIVAMIEEELVELKENPEHFTRNNIAKFLRFLNKQVKSVKNQSSRVMKKTKSEPAVPRSNSGNSGFHKPVKISNELARFAGWEENTPHSRVEVTKYICDYIREHNLQNPNDKRQIIPDPALQKLLGYNPKKDEEPLRYYSIQSCLKNQNHFLQEN